jgi:hypothetical protein
VANCRKIDKEEESGFMGLENILTGIFYENKEYLKKNC